MASDPLGNAVRHTLLRLQGGAAHGDAELLERFVASQDQAAFAELVRRHGPMVLRVCQRVLRHSQDAEDAFQATFAVLARKAARLDRRGPLSPWLYGVAYRAALELRKSVSKQRSRERSCDAAELPENSTSGAHPTVEQDVRPLLDEELQRLPDKYRTPVVLCYLQGKTTEEAAQLLQCPVGTVHWRLSRARDLLRDRLARRGLTLAAPPLAALLSHETATAALPPALGTTALRTALPATVLSERVGVLTNATLQALAPSKRKLAIAAVFALCAFGAGAALLLRGSESPPVPPAPAAPRAPAAMVPPAGGITHWDPLKKKFLRATSSQGAEITSAAWSRDGALLAVGRRDGSVEVYKGSEYTLLQKGLRGNSKPWFSKAFRGGVGLPVSCVAFSPDGKTLASLSGNNGRGFVALWDLPSTTTDRPDVKLRLNPTAWSVHAKLAFTPDGGTLIQHTERSEVALWDLATGKPKPFRLPEGCICLGIAADGSALGLYRGRTRDVVAWDLAANQERLLFHQWFDDNSFVMALSPQARKVAVELRKNNETRVFMVDVAAQTWTNLAAPGWSEWPAVHLMFAPDGTALAKTGAVPGQLVELKTSSPIAPRLP